uniref:lebercilin-like protein n=1 Tax=Myxine glutinosa TaxID=7769 RepID=UPI00358F6C93
MDTRTLALLEARDNALDNACKVVKILDNECKVVKILDNECKVVKILDNVCKVVKILDNECKVVKILDNECKVVKILDNECKVVKILDNECKVVKILDNECKVVKILDNECKVVKILDNECKVVKILDNECEVVKILDNECLKSELPGVSDGNFLSADMSDSEGLHPLLGEQKQHVQGGVTWSESELMTRSKTIQNIYGVAPRSACTEKGIRLPKLASNELPSHETSLRSAPGLPLPTHTFQFQMVTDLRNEAKELRRKLNDALRENWMIRQEHALARYESQEAEFPRLVASHIADTQVLHEAVRRAREAERISTKRATRCEAELNRSQKALQHLQELAERRDMKERGQLSQKLEQAEKQLEELKLDKQVLLKNLQLNKSSFQHQLLDKKRLTTKLQNSASLLRTEVQQLTCKLEDKERDLVTLSMHSARLFKSSSRKKEARQLKECVAGSVRSPGDSVSHIGSQQKGKVPPKKKRSDGYCDLNDCSEPHRKENQNGEEEELTTEAKVM